MSVSDEAEKSRFTVDELMKRLEPIGFEKRFTEHVTMRPDKESGKKAVLSFEVQEIHFIRTKLKELPPS